MSSTDVNPSDAIDKNHHWSNQGVISFVRAIILRSTLKSLFELLSSYLGDDYCLKKGANTLQSKRASIRGTCPKTQKLGNIPHSL